MSSPTPVSPAQVKLACSQCSLFQLCLPVGIEPADLELLDRIINRRRPLQRGEHLFRTGDPMLAIYAVRSGSIKSYSLVEDGREQVMGFHLPGELIGLDAFSSEHHTCSARALETTSVCEIPVDRMEELWPRIPSLPRQLLRVMSRDKLQDQTLLLQLSKKSAEERLAAFLLSLSQRYQLRGLSTREFHLSMSRVDIGNYLGLAVETVSRLFTRFQEEGLLSVNRKHVLLHDLKALHRRAGAGAGTPD